MSAPFRHRDDQPASQAHASSIAVFLCVEPKCRKLSASVGIDGPSFATAPCGEFRDLDRHLDQLNTALAKLNDLPIKLCGIIGLGVVEPFPVSGSYQQLRIFRFVEPGDSDNRCHDTSSDGGIDNPIVDATGEGVERASVPVAAPADPEVIGPHRDDQTVVSAAFPGESGEHTSDPALTAYLAWLAAYEEDARLGEELDAAREELGENNPEFKKMAERYWAANKAVHEADKLMDMPPAATTVHGIIAKFAFFTNSTFGGIRAHDIENWQSIVNDISRMGILPLEKQVSAFGDGRHFGPIARAAMSEAGIEPELGEITLPTSIWTRSAEQSVDADLYAAFDRWREAEERLDRDPHDEDAIWLERQSYTAVAKLPAYTTEGALLKLGAYSDFANEDYSLDDDHPAHHLARTLREAADFLGGRVGETIRFGIEKAEGANKQLCVTDDLRRKLSDKHNALKIKLDDNERKVPAALRDLELPLGKAEGAAETLFLLADRCGEGTEPVAYLANRLGEHLADMRRQWTEATTVVQQEGSGC